LSQGQRQQVFQQVLCRPGLENSLQFTVARSWGRGTSGLPSSICFVLDLPYPQRLLGQEASNG
jgi:hypothetical protein